MSPVELTIGKRITGTEVNQTRVEENVRRLGKRDPMSEYQTNEFEIVGHLMTI